MIFYFKVNFDVYVGTGFLHFGSCIITFSGRYQSKNGV